MRRLLALTRILVKNSRNPIATGKNRKVKGFLFVLLIALAFLPIMVQIGLMAHRMFGVLSMAGQEGILLAFGFSTASMLIFVFGILSVIAVYYFAQDLPVLLALPVRPYEILGAKFLTTLIHEYIAESLFIIPLFAAYAFHTAVNLPFIATAAAVFLLLPVIPVAMASVLVMAVMPFTGIARNRDRFGKIAGTLLLALVLAMNYFLQKHSAGPVDPASLIKMLTEGKNLWTLLINRMFPACGLAVSAVTGSGTVRGFTALTAYLLASSGVVAALLAIGERLYLRGVHGKAGGESVAAASRIGPEVTRTLSAGPALTTYLLKDLRILFRDPVLFMNCIVVNFFWPFFLVFAVAVGPGQDLGRAVAWLRQNSGNGMVYAVALGLGMVLASANGIASSAISREGKNLQTAKFIPVGYPKQILAKAGAAAVMGAAACLLMLCVAFVLFRLPADLLPAVLFLAACGIAFSVFTGVLIDLLFPKLTWDNAYKAVKQNINVPIHMALCTAVAGLTLWLVRRSPWDAGETFRFLSAASILVDAALIRLLTTRGARIFEGIEV